MTNPIDNGQKRSIREIPLPGTRRPQPQQTERKPINDYYQQRRRPIRTYVIIGLFVVVAAVAFFGMNLFASATIKIEAKRAESFVKTSLSISTSTDITADIVSSPISKTVEKTIVLPAESKQTVEEKAVGKVIIYNDFGPAQRLINRTRFQSPDGLIYRINQSVDIPAKPGKIEVTIYADEPGEEYNSAKTTFTIPGFVGTPQEKGFRVESVGEISGGFKGVKNVVSESQKTNAVSKLKEDISKDLKEAITKENPNAVIVDNLTQITFTDPKTVSDGNNVAISMSGTIEAVVLDKGTLALALAKKTISGNLDSGITIENFESLAISTSTSSPNSLNFEGQTKFQWVVDVEAIKNLLKDKPVSDKTKILASISSVYRANVETSPFWLGKFPGDTDKIKVILITGLDS